MKHSNLLGFILALILFYSCTNNSNNSLPAHQDKIAFTNDVRLIGEWADDSTISHSFQHLIIFDSILHRTLLNVSNTGWVKPAEGNWKSSNDSIFYSDSPWWVDHYIVHDSDHIIIDHNGDASRYHRIK